MGKVHVLDHPLIQHKLTFIRDVNTGTKEFRELVDEVAALMAFEITRNLQLQEVTVETPVGPAQSYTCREKAWPCSDSSCRTWNGRWNS